MCTYNGARFLAEQLASIRDQTRPPDELVVCDDCSTDESLSLMEQFAANTSFPYHIKRNNVRLGSTRTLQQAIRFCEDDVIALADHDDSWYPEKLSLIEKTFTEDPQSSLVFSDADVVDENSKSLGYTLWEALGF